MTFKGDKIVGKPTFAIIAIWMMIGGLAQCESARHLDDIRQELREIKHELYSIRYR